MEIYPNTVKTLSSFQLFPYKSTNAAIQFYHSQYGHIFKFSFQHVYRKRKVRQLGARRQTTIRLNNICQVELKGRTRGAPARQIMQQIVASSKFEAFCKKHDITCHHYMRNRYTYSPYVIGFNKFPAELALFLCQQVNQLYTVENSDY